jgi:hypothetical protein
VRRLTPLSAQDCVPNLPTDEQMAEMEMFESSLMVITDQEDEVLFNCDEDVRLLTLAQLAASRPAHSLAALPGGVCGDDVL